VARSVSYMSGVRLQVPKHQISVRDYAAAAAVDCSLKRERRGSPAALHKNSQRRVQGHNL
jgi:hypothetical protein